MPAPAPVPAWADRLYAALLLAYPAAFREEYAGEMRTAFRSRWREERQAHGLPGIGRLALDVLCDTLTTAARTQGEILARDLRDAWRSLTARPNWSFTAAALLTLSLGIGAVTAIFSVVNAVLLAPLPYGEPGRVVRLKDFNTARGLPDFSSSMPNFHSWEPARSFAHLAALRDADANLTSGGEPEKVNGIAVTARFWDVLGLPPVAGRSFTPEDDAHGRAPVAMISERLWKRRYGGDRAIVGRTIDVNLVPHLVVGIAPQDVGFSSNIDLWIPMGHDPDADESRGDRRLAVLGRLAPGVTLQQAQAEMSALAANLAREFPEANEGWSVQVTPIRDWIVRTDVAERLRIVLVAVALLLLVAATNVANLQMARALGRLREMGVRLALGASRARLVRQMLTENLLLTVTGGAAGVGLAWCAVRASALLPSWIPRREALAIDLPVLLVAAVAVGATALLAGLLPAGVAVRSSVRDALQQAGRTATPARSPARHALVAAQMALATTLLVGAALLSRSLVRLQNVSPGFGDPDHLMTAQLTRDAVDEASYKRNLAFHQALLEEVRTLPGVIDAALTSNVPFGDTTTGMPVVAAGRSLDLPGEAVQAQWRIATADYFRTMQVPLRRGRTFDPRSEPPSNLILSEGLVRRLWPGGEDPIDRQVQLGNRRFFTIVGVVGDMRQLGMAQDPTPTMYMAPTWGLWPTMTLVVRTGVPPAGLFQPVRQVVTRLDPHQPVSGFRTMRTAVAADIAAPRMNTVLLASFAGLALVLAVVGIAGVVGYTVGQRRHELAVRLTLGASPGQVMRLVMRAGLVTCIVGIVCGIAAALALGRALASVLYEVGARDPATLSAAGVALLVAAAVACWLPARRVTRISPALTLREG